MTTAVMQAMATGLPAITTDHSAFPDQIKDGFNGFLVREGDFEALAEKILYMIDHPELWPALGQNGRRHVEKNYSEQKIMEKQAGIYNEIINSR